MRELRALQGKNGRTVTGKVTRRTVEPYDHKGRRLVVSLEPGDVISIREERTRSTVSAPLARVYRQMLWWAAEAARATKKTKVKRGIL